MWPWLENTNSILQIKFCPNRLDPPPQKLGHQKLKKRNVYFAFKAILSILFFCMKNFIFLVDTKMGGVPVISESPKRKKYISLEVILLQTNPFRHGYDNSRLGLMWACNDLVDQKYCKLKNTFSNIMSQVSLYSHVSKPGSPSSSDVLWSRACCFCHLLLHYCTQIEAFSK